MAIAAPVRTPASVAAGAQAAPGTRQGLGLLLALATVLAYAVFAHGATRYPAETRVQVGLAALALVGCALWLGGSGVRVATPRRAWQGTALLTLYALWAGLSLLWSVAPDRTWLELNRSLGYVLAVVLGIAVAGSARNAIERLALAWLAIALAVALYALGGKVLPGVHVTGLFDLNQTDTVARLRAPLQYWNALALVCALGVPVAIRVAADTGRRRAVRLAGLAGTFVLLVDMGLTYSRGGVLALVTAMIAMTALGGGRLRGLGVLLLASAATVPGLDIAFSRPGLTGNGVPLAQRVSDGHALLGALVVSLAALLAAGWYLLMLERRVSWSPARSRKVWKVLRASAVVAVVILVGSVAASPRGLTGTIQDASDSFTKVKKDTTQYDPVRLVSTSSGNRWVWWKEAAGAASDRPFGGWGAGSFPVTHLLYRRNEIPVAQPHSVPLQLLAEDGLVGFALFYGGLGLLLVVAYRRVRALGPTRERDFAAALFAIVVAWVVHGAYDWDLDIPGVSLPAFAMLGALCGWGTPFTPRGRPFAGRAPVFSDPEARGLPGGLARALVLAAATVAAAAFAISSILPSVSDAKASAAQDAVSGDATPAQLVDAAADADLAARLNPLSDAPLFVEDAIAERRGRLLDARRDLLDAVKREPWDSTAWTNLASLAFTLADRTGFERAIRRAVALDPANGSLRKLAVGAEVFLAPVGDSATATGTPLPAAGVVAAAPAPAATTVPAPTAPAAPVAPATTTAASPAPAPTTTAATPAAPRFSPGPTPPSG